MVSAVRFMHRQIKVELGEALRMATTYPCAAISLNDAGHLAIGAPADFVWLSEEIEPLATWIGGEQVVH